MAENLNQDDINSLIEQMQAGNASLAGDAQAVTEAAKTAESIAAVAESAASPAPVPTPQATAPAPAAHPSPADFAPEETVSAPENTTGAPVFSPEVQKLLAIEVPVIVQLGVRRMSVGEVMRFSVGAIIEFQKSAEEELELLANNKGIGNGHAVKVGENFGIKITRISPVKETIRRLGAA